jgi:uncharacterized protein YfaS (alpha-2-macroglobulin family)
LEVVRWSPEGAVERVRALSITFSQPMVAVTRQEALSAEEVPARLTPQPEGRWRWVGTRTLIFETDAGFPMATEYRVEVPAGAVSALGGRLERPVRWRFRTPPPRLLHHYPAGGRPTRRDPVLFAVFDQRIDPGALLRHVAVRARGRGYSVRRATSEEIAADERVKRLAERAPEGRWVAFRAVSTLPGDAQVRVVIEAGAPSAEGPLATDTAQAFTFRTHGPLQVVEVICGWRDECPPGTRWMVRFSNPLDEDAFDPSQVRVEPELDGLRSRVWRDWLVIRGRSRPRQTYRVVLSADIRDAFGGTLGDEVELTVKVGPRPRELAADGGKLVVLDPLGPRRFTVRTVNHRSLWVRLYRVEPKDWPAFAAGRRYGVRDERPWTPPGQLVWSDTVGIDAEPDAKVETAIDLTPALRDGLGHVVVAAEAVDSVAGPLGRRRRLYVWVQSTRLAVSAAEDRARVWGWVTSLADGAPVAGAELALVPRGGRAVTDADGLGRLPLREGRKRSDPGLLLVARLGPDEAFVPVNGWRRSRRDPLAWYAFTDRPLYRPGEDVHVKGWVRVLARGGQGDVALPPGRLEAVRYTVYDARRGELASGRARLNDRAGFDFAFRLPEESALGPATVQLEVEGKAARLERTGFVHRFRIEEFRRPEYEVSVTHDAGPHIVGGAARFELEARYFAGGGLPDSEVRWRVEARPTGYRPPNTDGFAFGGVAGPRVNGLVSSETYTARTDLSGRHALRAELLKVDPPVPMRLTAAATVYDANRQAWSESTTVVVHPAALYVGLRPSRRLFAPGEPLVVDAIVTTVDGERVGGREVKLELARIEWKRVKGEWQTEYVHLQSCTVVSQTGPVSCRFTPDGGGAYRVRAAVADDAGRVSRTEISVWSTGWARATEERVDSLELVADREVYEPGDTAQILVHSPFAAAEGVLTLRREGVVGIERFRMDGPSRVLRVPVTEAHIPNVHVSVEVVARPAEAAGVADVFPDEYAAAQVELSVSTRARRLEVRATPRSRRLRPGGATAVDVEVRDARGQPVADADVALLVVDEAVLALLPEPLRDPVAAFHPKRSGATADYRLRDRVIVAWRTFEGASGAVRGAVYEARTGAPIPGAQVYLEGTGRGGLTDESGEYVLTDVPPGRYVLVAEMLGYATERRRIALRPGGRVRADFSLEDQAIGVADLRLNAQVAEVYGQRDASATGPPILLRADFTALAAFVGSARTDADGRVTVPAKVPDNLTRYRVIAVAAAGAKEFGKGESTLTVALPLMARPSPPRFLNYGDRFELPVVVQNLTDASRSVDVAVRAVNLEWTAGRGRRVDVPGGGRVEVRFPAAALAPGTAWVQVAAASGADADAALVEIPVWTPATTEAFATYGELDDGAAAIPVEAPRDVIPGFGGLEITTSATALQALTDAVLYLVDYPYECAEQIASRILAVAALRDVLTALAAEGLPDPDELVAAVERDIERLSALQNGDGGFPLWARRRPSWPYVSVHAAHALVRAKDKGFRVPGKTLRRSWNYLRAIDAYIPDNYPQRAERAIKAYALYVRHLMNDAARGEVRSLIEDGGLESLPLEAAAWLLAVAAGTEASDEAAALRRYIANRASETAGMAQFATGYGDGDYLVLYSSRRVDAIVLDALIADRPENDLIPKVVRGLLAHRIRGRWTNTQENVFVLLALDRYFRTYERATPDFVARLWLGDDYVGGHAFRGRTTDRRLTEVPMDWLLERPDRRELIVSKEGPGRLYYRIGMRYAPADLVPEPAEHGFSVARTYEAVDDSADVRREPDGTWVVRAGARVRVRLTLAAPERRYHVALVDPLPAGFEALNPELAGFDPVRGGPGWPWREPTVGAARFDPARAWLLVIRPWPRWYEHENLRDERAEAFTSLLWPGVHSYTYLARATTPGEFVVPPPKAEEMYSPETFGRGGRDRVIVR